MTLRRPRGTSPISEAQVQLADDHAGIAKCKLFAVHIKRISREVL